ncbi:copper resistance protein B [Idiomarina tyrosinivorans]|uniref:Copper resistance protein B n=2 Tax=Idiomarina tyrosinivorans TaxID=1445662 RepID=A0A432ZTJ6_9GAMM|nr:copper resistance protein B [Idiomarina tyrosinivorans]
MKKLLTAIAVSVLATPLAYADTPDDWSRPVPEHYFAKVLFDRLEWAAPDQAEQQAVWDMQAWYGNDYNRIVFRSEGGKSTESSAATELERAEVMYDRIISPFWSARIGVGTRGELSSDSEMENYAVLALNGLAPYWFEMDHSLLINDEGDAQLISEVEYDVMLSQIDYLQPRVELTTNITDSEKYDRHGGLSHLRVGLRYRHEFAREFAPYIGVYWDKSLGQTANQLQQQGQGTSDWGFVIGARLWF